jgi:hypothetical protein
LCFADQVEWQQANPAEQQLLWKLQQEHQQLQQQLAEAQQHIAMLTAGSISNAAPTAILQLQSQLTPTTNDKGVSAKRRTSMAGNSSNSKAAVQQEQKQQRDVLLQPSPGVQVLTIVRSDSDGSADDRMQDGNALPAATKPASSMPPASLDKHQQLRGDSTAENNQEHLQLQLKPNGPQHSPRPTTAGAASEANSRTASKAAGRRATTTGVAPAANSSSKSSPPRRASTAAARPKSSSAAAQQLLSLEQQQALVERLQHAEHVMQMLHGDLQASLEQHQQLAHQLEQSHAAQEQLKQQQQQQQQQENEQSNLPQEDAVSRAQHMQVVQQLNDVQQELCDMQQQLLQAQAAAEQSNRQLAVLQVQLEQQQGQHAEREVELQQCITQLQQQLGAAVLLQAQGAAEQQQPPDEMTCLSGEEPAATGSSSALEGGTQANSQLCMAISAAAEASRQLGGWVTAKQEEEDAVHWQGNAEEEPEQQQEQVDQQQHKEVQEQQASRQQQQQEQQQVEQCLHCKKLKQQVQHLQQLLQRAANQADAAPETAANGSDVEQNDSCHAAAAAAAASPRRQAQLRVKQQRSQQELQMKTLLYPVAPELAALQATAAATLCCEQQYPPSAREHGAAAAYTSSAWQLQACSEEACETAHNTASSTAALLPEALMLAGVRKMRPLSYSPAQSASSSSGIMPADGVVGTSLTSRQSRKLDVRSSGQQALQLSSGAERLLQEALLAGQLNGQCQQDRQAFLQVAGGAAAISHHEAAGAAASAAGVSLGNAIAGCNTSSIGEGAQPLCQLAEQGLQPVITGSTVRWTCRSSSPRRNTPRSARPASAANLCITGGQGRTGMRTHGSSRPQTARSYCDGPTGGGQMTARTHLQGSGCMHASQSCAESYVSSAPATHSSAVPSGSWCAARVGSAMLTPAAVPRLNLGVLKP